VTLSFDDSGTVAATGYGVEVSLRNGTLQSTIRSSTSRASAGHPWALRLWWGGASMTQC